MLTCNLGPVLPASAFRIFFGTQTVNIDLTNLAVPGWAANLKGMGLRTVRKNRKIKYSSRSYFASRLQTFQFVSLLAESRWEGEVVQ